MGSRWVTLNQLAAETGFAVRTLQYIRQQEPGVLITRERGSKVEYKQPECATNLLRRERELGKRDVKPANFEEARGRKMEAEAREAELRVEQMLGNVVPLDVVERTVARMCDSLMPVLQNVPANYGLRLEELGVPAQRAEQVLEAISVELTTALRATIEDADEDEQADADSDAVEVA